MSNILVINAAGQETRVALIENGLIAEYYLERKNEKGILGNIYKGRVVRVLPGMQAAFVDIGLEKAAFLYVADIVSDPTFPGFSEELEAQASAVEGDPLEAEDAPEPSESAPLDGNGDAAQAVVESGTVPPPTATESIGATAGLEAVEVRPAAAAAESGSGVEPRSESESRSESQAQSHSESDSPAQAGSQAQPESESDAQSKPASESPSGEPILELSPDDALEEGDDDEDDDEEDEPEDEADAMHAAAEEVVAAEEAAKAGDGQPVPPAPAAVEGAATEAGQRGVPAEQKGAPRERRGRRRGGRGRKRHDEKRRAPGGPQEPRKQGDQPRREAQGGRPGGEQNGRRDKNGQDRKKQQIQDLLKEGDEVLVQVVKDPIGTKGARITCHISLPGRHLVFMPTVDHVGISRRIENEKERRRLRELVDQFRPPGTGFIVRTVAENEPREKLVADIKFLLGLWNEVGKKKDQLKAPALLHPDLDLILRSIRDLFSDEVDKVVIDERAEYERVKAFMEQVAPELAPRVELFQGDEPIFDEYGVEQELLKAQNRKVWLKSGGYIIIDQTEALVAIDVNSGRYTGKKSLEETITKINCEAAKEIVYQLRLRNIGGIIIIDFIDMDKGQNRDKVYKTLQEALAQDRAKTNVLKISDIGLVEMTRKRVRESVGRLTTENCPVCDGRGHVRSKATIGYEIMRECQRAAKKHREDQLVVHCHPEVAKFLQGPERDAMRLLMMKLNKSIVVRPQPQYHQEQYDLHGKWSRPELQQGERGRPPNVNRGNDRDRGRGRGDRGGGREKRDERGREAPAEAEKSEQPAQAQPDRSADKVST